MYYQEYYIFRHHCKHQIVVREAYEFLEEISLCFEACKRRECIIPPPTMLPGGNLFCHRENQPVLITRNGEGDLVVLSQGHYERLQNQIELYRKLGEAESLEASAEKCILHAELMNRLKARIE